MNKRVVDGKPDGITTASFDSVSCHYHEAIALAVLLTEKDADDLFVAPRFRDLDFAANGVVDGFASTMKYCGRTLRTNSS